MELSQTQTFDINQRIGVSLTSPKLVSTQPKASLESALNSIFMGSQEVNRLLQAKTIMGDVVNNLSDDELNTYITEFQSLLDSWLDGFEKELFDNKTLKQLLKEG